MSNFLKDYLTLLVKPTTFCNLSCEYCYQRNKQFVRAKRMDDETLKKLIQEACNLNIKNIAFEWIGGETLLAGIEFFEKALFYQQKFNIKGINIANAIQTNGTPLNNDWIDFFKRNKGYGLSVSYDCFEELHNQTRKTQNSKGTFEKVSQKLDLLMQNNIAFGILITISENSLQYPPSEWIKRLVEKQLFHVGLQLDYNKYSDNKFISRYYYFLKGLFAEQAEYNHSVIDIKKKLLIRESYYLANILKTTDQKRISCQHMKRACTSYLLSIGVNGDVYACCDAFLGMLSKEYNNFLCGNINNENFVEIFNSLFFNQIYADMEDSKKKCSSCNYFKLCNGGCGLFKFLESGKIVSGPDDIIYNYCAIQQNYFNLLTDIKDRKNIKTAYGNDF